MSDLMNNIKDLREMTGAGFLDCKKALEENDYDIDKSVSFLRKKGLAKANKKSSREAKEGAVGIYFNENIVSIIQINTETDFAAKNEIFLNFMDKIGKFSLSKNDHNLTLSNFNNLVFEDSTVDNHFKDIISKIGENIILSKLIFIKINEKLMISNYIHNSYRKNIGKIAVVLKADVIENNEESKVLGKNLCMHIAASKPLALDLDSLDKELIKKEKEIQLETIKSSGKPDNIIEKILEGKMKKFYSESTFLNQKYILDPDKTILEVLTEFSKKNKFEIIDYKLLILKS
jgi:elongation factor Ts